MPTEKAVITGSYNNINKTTPTMLMLKNPIICAASSLALAAALQSASARTYDNFANGNNWTLDNNGGSAVVETNALVLTAPAGVLSNPTAKLNLEQVLTDSRQSILVENHIGV